MCTSLECENRRAELKVWDGFYGKNDEPKAKSEVLKKQWITIVLWCAAPHLSMSVARCWIWWRFGLICCLVLCWSGFDWSLDVWGCFCVTAPGCGLLVFPWCNNKNPWALTLGAGIPEWPEAILEERIWLWHQQSLQLHFIPRYLPALGQSSGREQKVNQKASVLWYELSVVSPELDFMWIGVQYWTSKHGNIKSAGARRILTERIQFLLEQYYFKEYALLLSLMLLCSAKVFLSFNLLIHTGLQGTANCCLIVVFSSCTVWEETLS